VTSQPSADSGRPVTRSAVSELVHTCERCGERMEERKCKIICQNCGYYRDCSDP
jgi:hypothetical protein